MENFLCSFIFTIDFTILKPEMIKKYRTEFKHVEAVGADYTCCKYVHRLLLMLHAQPEITGGKKNKNKNKKN